MLESRPQVYGHNSSARPLSEPSGDGSGLPHGSPRRPNDRVSSTEHRALVLVPPRTMQLGAGTQVDRPSRVHAAASGSAALAAKRAIDIVLAVAILIVLLPLLVAIAIAIAVQSAGSPVFSQTRVGRDGKTFRCWKFRTMYRDAESTLRNDTRLWANYVANDFKLNSDDDPRITSVGRPLRRTSIDELPQLLNVLAGHMSIVGPRPVVSEELGCYGPWAGAYLAVRPGLTGAWQVSGRSCVRYPERAELTGRYVETWSLWNDCKIMAKTPATVLRKVGAH